MIFWTEPAMADLLAVKEYIKRDSEFFSKRFVESDDENIREVLYQNYRIIDKLFQEDAFILAVIHQAKDY